MHGQRDAVGSQHSRSAAAKTPTEAVARGIVLVNREGAFLTVVSEGVVTVDTGWFPFMAAMLSAPLTMSTNDR